MSHEDGDSRNAPVGRRRSLVYSAAQTYGANFAVAALSLVNVLVVARVLGASGRGEVAFLITVCTMSAHLASMCIQEANGNLAATEPDARPALATNSVLFAVALGLLGAASVVVLVVLFPAVGGPVDQTLLGVVLLFMPVRIASLYLGLLVQADYHFRASNAAWIAGPATTATLNTVLGVAGLLSVTAATGVWLIGQILGVAILVVFIVRHAGFGRPDRRLARRAIGFGLKVQFSRVMSVGNYRADQWVLGAISGSRELGVYSVAFAWAEMLFYLPGVLVLVQRPDLARATRERAAAFAARVFRVAVILAALAAAGLIVAAPLLCGVVFGDEFDDSVPMLRVLALGAFGICALEQLSGAMVAQRKPWEATVGIAVAAVVGLSLDFLLIPAHGGLGASVAAVISYTAGGIVTAIAFVGALGGRFSDLAPRAGELRWFVGRLRSRLG